MNSNFNADHEAARIIRWAQYQLADTKGKPIVIGISGGKDSTITAAALCEALGSHRVLGVLMPNGVQADINVARDVCKFLEIQSIEVNINDMYRKMLWAIKESARNFADEPFNSVVTSNAPCRCRMVTLYTIANQLHGRVANTCNLSESFVGYDTKWGDQCGDFGLFQNFTASEVKQMGYSLGVLPEFIEKAPDDGMCGQTDEERWGFTYDYLDSWIRRGGKCENETDATILRMHKAALHKIMPIQLPCPPYQPDGSHFLTMTANACDVLLYDYLK